MYLLPTNFHIPHTSGIYRYLETSSSDFLSISFENCSWADHFELQKLALRLASLNNKFKRIVIRCPEPSDGPTAPANVPQLEVVEYASRMNFFAVLQKAYGEGLVIQFGNRSITAQSEAQLQNDLLLALPAKRWETYHNKTYIPMQAVSDQRSVELLTKGFSTGAQVQELVDYYSELDFVTSGEFATLVVHELMQNIVDHAWSSLTQKGIAAVSLCTVDLGNRKDPVGRYQNRLRFAPEYERQFLLTLQGPGYLELCVSDTGVGIHTTLAQCQGSFPEWFPDDHEPRAEKLLAAAFWAPVTRDPGPHRPGHRGLYYVAESVREYEGVLACQSGALELSIVASDPSWKAKYLTRSPLAFTAEENVTSLKAAVTGTHFRILLPLMVRRLRRRYWDLKLSPMSVFVALETSPDGWPKVAAAPSAPLPNEIEADAPSAMTNFRQRCREVVNATTQTSSSEQGWFWISCSGARGWRKHHIHVFLEEIIAASSIRTVCLVNVPSSVFQPFVLVARHVTSTESGKLITLLDERGRRGLICRTYDQLHVDFMRWAVDRSAFQPDSSIAGELLASVVDQFGSLFHGLTFADSQFLMARAGIEAEFLPTLEAYRATTTVQIAPQCFIEGYIEFDEALRDLHFLRAVASYVHLIRNYLLKNAGIIAIRRAATRLIEFQSHPDDTNLWIMTTPDPKNAPPADWLLRRSQLCLLTDVISSGDTLHRLLTDLALETADLDGPRVVCIAPLEVKLLDAKGAFLPTSFSQTVIPGISELILTNGMRVPVFSILPTSARTHESGDPLASRPEPASNILFQPSLMKGDLPNVGEMAASDFIRLAEREKALWLGHISITHEHFDLEFNMIRLLREGSIVLGQFCEQVADRVIESEVDAIVYPDESRIHLALSAIEEALMSRGAPLPKTIRLRRSESGDFFIRPADNSDLLAARSLLLLDDAINSGGTAHQMLTGTLELVPSGAKAHLQVLISRQPRHEERLLSEVAAVRNSNFSYSAFVRIPVPFYSAISCPSCRARNEAKAVAAGLGPHSPVAAVLEDFANSLAPTHVYAGAPPVADREPALRYSVPALDETPIRWQQFTTLSGAKAAISCAVGIKRGNLDDLIANCTEGYTLQFPLAAFLTYALFSRGDIPESLLQSSLTERFWKKTCDAVKKAARDLAVERSVVSIAACELSLACWCAPARSRGRMFADLVKLGEHLLNDTAFYGWLMFLAFITRETTSRESEIQEEIIETLTTVRNQLSAVGQKMHRGLGTVESFMRLRQVIQAFSGVPITEPWLEGVVDLLEMLSYKAGHTRRDYLSEDEVAWAESLLTQLNLAIAQNEVDGSGSPNTVGTELWSEIGNFLDRPHPYLGVLAKSLTASLGGWFRAVQYSSPGSINIGGLLGAATVSEKLAGELNDLLDEALISHRQRMIRPLSEQFAQIVTRQRALHESLYAKNVDGGFVFRTEVEKLLCPLYDLSSKYVTGDLQRELAKSGRRVSLEGSLFEYLDGVRSGGDDSPRWCVLLAPRNLVDDILGDVLIDNLKKHVLSSIPKRAIVIVRADVVGIGSVEHRTKVIVSIEVNGVAWPLPKNLWTRTLGKHRDTMLRLYGGNIQIADKTNLIVEFLSGHF